MRLLSIAAGAVRGFALCAQVFYRVVVAIFRLLFCRCFQAREEMMARSHRVESKHMEWTRQYYWKASKARCLQRLIISLAMFVSAGMLYFDTQLLPRHWSEGEEDEIGIGMLHRDEPLLPVPNPSNFSGVPDILILVSPGKGHAYDHRQWVDTVLDTWGGNLPESVGLVFLHCTKVQNETTWCPPGRLLEFEAFVWALRQTLENSATRRWIVRVQLGTYVILSNLIRYLSTFDSSLPHFLGHRIVTETTAYHEPPAGLALTFAAASLLTVRCAQIHRYSLRRTDRRESELAAAMAKCSTESGVRISSTSTIDGKTQ